MPTNYSGVTYIKIRTRRGERAAYEPAMVIFRGGGEVEIINQSGVPRTVLLPEERHISIKVKRPGHTVVIEGANGFSMKLHFPTRELAEHWAVGFRQRPVRPHLPLYEDPSALSMMESLRNDLARIAEAQLSLSLSTASSDTQLRHGSSSRHLASQTHSRESLSQAAAAEYPLLDSLLPDPPSADPAAAEYPLLDSLLPDRTTDL